MRDSENNEGGASPSPSLAPPPPPPPNPTRKLSRKRRPLHSVPPAQLDDSAEEFRAEALPKRRKTRAAAAAAAAEILPPSAVGIAPSEPVGCRKRSARTAATEPEASRLPPPVAVAQTEDDGQAISVTSSADVSSTAEAVPDCPLCGQSFRQSLARSQHLKTCGGARGLTPAQLVQIKRLEEKQAEERRALGLPAVPPKLDAGLADSSRASNRSKNVSRTRVAATVPTSADPHLEMALALSASLAQSEEAKKEEESQYLQSLGVDAKPTAEAKQRLVPSSAPTPSVPEVLLPSAASWPVMSGSSSSAAPKPRKKGQSRAKTTLEVRTDEARAKQVAEEVANILARAGGEKESLAGDGAADLGCTPKRPRLAALYARERAMWRRAGSESGSFYGEIIRPYLEADKKSGGDDDRASDSNKMTSETSATCPPSTDPQLPPGLQELSACWERLFDTGDRADLTVYTKDEGVIRCHSLVLLARCKQILDDTLQETDGAGRTASIVSWDSVSEKAARVFLRYMYCGRVAKIDKTTVYEGVAELCRRYKVGGALLERLKGVDRGMLIPEEAEEDFGSEPEEGEEGMGGAASSPVAERTWSSQDFRDEENGLADDERGRQDDDDYDDDDDDVAVDVHNNDDDGKDKDGSVCSHSTTIHAEGNNSELDLDGAVGNKVNDFPIEEEDDDDASLQSDEDLFSSMTSACTATATATATVIATTTTGADAHLTPINGNCLTNLANGRKLSHFGGDDKDDDKDNVCSHSTTAHGGEAESEKSPPGKDEHDSFDLMAESPLPQSPAPQDNTCRASAASHDELPSLDDVVVVDSSPAELKMSSLDKSSSQPQHQSSQQQEDPSHSAVQTGSPFVDDVWDNFDHGDMAMLPMDDDDDARLHLADASPSPLPPPATSAGTPLTSRQRSSTPRKVRAPPSRRSPTPRRSLSPPRQSPPADAATTPLPDYEAMLTPALRRELKRYGLKAIPRTKAVRLLTHIYTETRPKGQGQQKKEEQEEKQQDQDEEEEQPQHNSSQGSLVSSDDGEDFPEESILRSPSGVEGGGGESVPASQLPSEQDLCQLVKEFIRSDRTLHTRVLLYEPIWLEDFFERFKVATKVKCRLAQVSDVLDGECITFRTRSRSKANQNRKAKSPKKKRPPAKAKRKKASPAKKTAE